MKVALLGPASSIHAVRWANALANAGLSLTLISQHDLRHELTSGISFFRLPFCGPTGYFRNAPVLKRLLNNVMPDILNTHYASGYGTTARLSRFSPSLLSVWGSDVYEFPTKSPLHRWILRRNVFAATRVASTSSAMADELQAIVRRTDGVQITPFGVDLDIFSPKASIDGNAPPITIGTIKSLGRKYGVDTLIDAFSLLEYGVRGSKPAREPVIKLRIVGDGSERLMLEAQVRDRGIGHLVEFVGQVAHEDVPAELAKLDIYVALSRQESFGVAILEASASGLPVVTSDVGGLPEVVDPGRTGFIVPSDNAPAAAEALKYLIEDQELRRSMGVAGRQLVQERFDWRKNVSHMISIYEDTIRHYRNGLRGESQNVVRQ